MAVEETLSDEQLAQMEARSKNGGLIESHWVALGFRELINLRSLWKQKRLWRYAGVEDEGEDIKHIKQQLEYYKKTVLVLDAENNRLFNYLQLNYDATPKQSETLVGLAIRLLEQCRGADEARNDELGPWYGTQPDGTFGMIETLPKPPGWSLPSDQFPPTGTKADPVPSEPEPEPAEPAPGKPGRRVARGRRTEGQGSGEGRGAVGRPEAEEKPGKGSKNKQH